MYCIPTYQVTKARMLGGFALSLHLPVFIEVPATCS